MCFSNMINISIRENECVWLDEEHLFVKLNKCKKYFLNDVEISKVNHIVLNYKDVPQFKNYDISSITIDGTLNIDYRRHMGFIDMIFNFSFNLK